MGVRNRWAVLALGILMIGLSLSAQQAQPKYGIEEYNDFTAAVNEQDPQARVRALDAFLQKYPDSTLRPFVFQGYLQIYQGASNWPKVVEYADKFLALDSALVEGVYKQPSQTDEQVRAQVALLTYQTLSLRARAFLLSFQNKGPQADAAAEKAAGLAQRGLERLERISRPPNVTPDRWAGIKKGEAAVFHTVLGNVAFRKKDYDTAAREYKVVVDQNPNDAFYTYRLGVSYLQASQPNYLPGFWVVARAVALFPDNQKKGVHDYLVSKLRAYQGYADLCPLRHAEEQADKLIAQAKDSATPPPTWTLLSAKDVMAVGELTVKRIFDELKTGGEQQQLIWLASCGMELPDVPGKVLEVMESEDNLLTLRLAVGEEAADADIANVEVKVMEPPEAKKLKPGDIVRVTAVLTDYQSEPFLLRLTEGRVNPEDIP